MLSLFSPNMIKTYKICPKKFHYQYIEHLNIPCVSSKFEKGKKIHALANYYLQGINITRIETVLTDEEKLIWKTLLENPYFRKYYYKSEYQISCKINNYWIGGRLDAVVRDYDDYYILDYKTGSIPKNPQYDYQTMIYLLCLDRILGKYNSMSFVYIDLKNKNNHIIELNENLKIDYIKQLTEICNEIINDTKYQPNNSNCKNCEYANICSL